MIVNDTVVVCITAAWVPVIVNGNVPVPALADNETVNVDAAVGLTGVGSEHVAPGGQPLTARFTLPLNPLKAVTVIVEVAVPPGTSVNEDGFAETRKSGLVDAYASTSAMRLQTPSAVAVTDTRIFEVASGAKVN